MSKASARTATAEPSRLLHKLSQRLFTEADDRQQFLACFQHPQPLPACILWCEDPPDQRPFECLPPQLWQPAWVDRLVLGERPGTHLLHQQGAFYCLDFSSVFAASPLLTLPSQPSLVVDVCAAPGGKSVFAARSLQPGQLLSNEVVGKRVGTLRANLQRCHIHPAIVTSLDPAILAQEVPQTAAVAIVDAPCTGQSLLVKGEKAPGCFHPVTINGNANRQKRILANSAELVAPQGYLLYMTCTYSLEENEQVVAWLCQRFPQFEPTAVPHLAAYQSPWIEAPCYRLFPQQGLGAGAFTALLKNTQPGTPSPLPTEFLARSGLTVLTG